MSNESVHDVRNQVFLIFQTVVGVAPPRGDLTIPQEVSCWNSLTHIKLVHAIERHFRGELPEELLMVGKPLGDLVEAVQAF